MIVAVDVHYPETGGARSAAVVFADWDAATPDRWETHWIEQVEEYEPGQFYRRELPCLLPLIAEVRNDAKISTIVVDGYVDLEEGRAGLGRHLSKALGDAIEVVGVAKTRFREAPAHEVFRGTSDRPLFVSSTGDVARATEGIAGMAGEFRIPDLLKLADRLARGHAQDA